MLPQKYIVLGSSESLILPLLGESGYKEINLYDYTGPDEIFLFGHTSNKDNHAAINPYIRKFPIYTPRQVFMKIETLDRLIEYSPEELVNLEIMLTTYEDWSVIYLAAKLVARMRPDVMMKFINLYPRVFYSFSAYDKDIYIRIAKNLAGEIVWSYQSEFI